MPIYEYECQSCSHHIEVLQKISDEALTVCEQCHQPALRKLVSRAGFELKGTGWYATDFRGNSSGTSSKETKDVPKTDSNTDQKTGST